MDVSFRLSARSISLSMFSPIASDAWWAIAPSLGVASCGSISGGSAWACSRSGLLPRHGTEKGRGRSRIPRPRLWTSPLPGQEGPSPIPCPRDLGDRKGRGRKCTHGLVCDWSVAAVNPPQSTSGRRTSPWIKATISFRMSCHFVQNHDASFVDSSDPNGHLRRNLASSLARPRWVVNQIGKSSGSFSRAASVGEPWEKPRQGDADPRPVL